MENFALLDQKELCELLKIKRTTLWRLMKKDDDFPKPIMILTQKKWKKSEIEEYFEKRRGENNKEYRNTEKKKNESKETKNKCEG